MNIDDLKIQEECAGEATGAGLNALHKEDLWFRQHEAELMEAARARQASEPKCKSNA